MRSNVRAVLDIFASCLNHEEIMIPQFLHRSVVEKEDVVHKKA